MRILLIGSTGQIGWELAQCLPSIGTVIALSRHQLDLTHSEEIRQAVRAIRPNIIVNAAAYTAVDHAEAERSLAYQINAVAPKILAEEAKRFRALLVHYSTDYVFDGTAYLPYLETDASSPLNVYGETKRAGEEMVQASECAHLIFRTSWVYGIRGKNFLRTILRLAQENRELRIVDDQWGAPTWSSTIARCTAEIIRQLPARRFWSKENFPEAGLYHLTAGGRTSWCGFARAILQLVGMTHLPVVPISTKNYPLPARRPSYSLLDNTKLKCTFGIYQRHWYSELRNCLTADQSDASKTEPSLSPTHSFERKSI